MSIKEDRLDGFIFDPDKFFKNSKPCTFNADVMCNIQKECVNQFVDPLQIRDNEDWSFLADKVVGSELQKIQ